MVAFGFLRPLLFVVLSLFVRLLRVLQIRAVVLVVCLGGMKTKPAPSC